MTGMRASIGQNRDPSVALGLLCILASFTPTNPPQAKNVISQQPPVRSTRFLDKKTARRGARTLNLEIKSLTRYRLCQPGVDGKTEGLSHYSPGILSPASSFAFPLGLQSIFGLGFVVDHGCTASSVRFQSSRTLGTLPIAFPLFASSKQSLL
jgi:hypothetical protein